MKIESLKGLRLKGKGKIFHNLFLFFTYPFRHSFKFLGLLLVVIVVLIAIPMTQGVSYKHVLDWYMLKYDETKLPIKKNIITPEPAERKLKNEYRKEFKFKETAAPSPRYVSDAVRKKMGPVDGKDKSTKRKTFNISKSQFNHVSLKNTWSRNKPENDTQSDISEANNKPQAKLAKVTYPVKLKIYPVDPIDKEVVVDMPTLKNKISYRKIASLPLKYEENLEHIEGETLVFTANEIGVADKYIILYGIYTDPNKHNEQDAYNYLKELADKKHIECEIVAYTTQNYATGLCFIDGMSINQSMVDAGFADNIAL